MERDISEPTAICYLPGVEPWARHPLTSIE
jgi:hypothetical protein